MLGISFLQYLEQVRLDLESDWLLLLDLRFAKLSDLMLRPLEKRRIKLVHDRVQEVPVHVPLRMLWVIRQILANLRYVVNLLHDVLHSKSIQLLHIDVRHRVVEEVELLTSEQLLEEINAALILGREEYLTYSNCLNEPHHNLP